MHAGRWNSRILIGAFALASLMGRAAVAQPAQSVDATQTVEERLADLDQRLRVLARLREITQDSLYAALRAAPVVAASRDGFSFRSADGQFQLRFRGYFQTDTRIYEGSDAAPATSTILLRRIRPILEATLYQRFGVRVMPDFGQGTTALFDAYGEARLWPALAIRAGKFKPPISLERLQSATDIRFAERGLPTNLAPNRDLGWQLSGDLLRGRLSYAAGYFDGIIDLGTSDGDAQNSKDVAGRVTVQPFARPGVVPTVDLVLGVAASSGAEQGTLAAPAVSSYRTPGQIVVYRLRSDGTAPNTVIAKGTRTRLAPQGYVNVGPFGLLAEYTQSSQEVVRDVTGAKLTTTAWQAAASWFLTGERAAFTTVTPKTVFNPQAHTWGAFELVGRYGALNADDAAFPTFANPATSISAEKSYGVGVNWYLARYVKLLVDYEHTTFTGGAATGSRAPETFIVTRLQTGF